MNIPANIPEWKKQKYRMVQSWQTLNQSCKPGQTVFTGSSLMEMFPVEKFAAEEGPDFPIVYNRGVGTAVYHSISDEDIFDIIRLPYVMVGSDGLVGSREEKCHPRGWGTMARAICAMTKDNAILPLETLIHRNTGMAAARFGLKNKGLLLDGYDADLVLFDYDRIIDHADYVNPFQLNAGIWQVYVGGKLNVQDNAPMGNWNGKILR